MRTNARVAIARLIDKHPKAADLICHEMECWSPGPWAIRGRMDFSLKVRDTADVRATDHRKRKFMERNVSLWSDSPCGVRI